MQRLAFELLLNVGARRFDVVGLGRQHVRSGLLSFRTHKTDTPVVGLPLLPEVVAALAAMPDSARRLTFIETSRGQLFTPAGFTNWFRDSCDAAGIPRGYSAHGLRKASATRLAEAGATTAQLMSWLGWCDPRIAMDYVRAAEGARLNLASAELLSSPRRQTSALGDKTGTENWLTSSSVSQSD